MMTDDSNSFTEIKIEDWSVAFSDAMSRTPFDGIFHRLYLAMDVDWYTGPESAKSLAHRLFDSLMDGIYKNGNVPKKNTHSIASGCLEIELRVYPKNIQCHISFDAVTAHAMSYIKR